MLQTSLNRAQSVDVLPHRLEGVRIHLAGSKEAEVRGSYSATPTLAGECCGGDVRVRSKLTDSDSGFDVPLEKPTYRPLVVVVMVSLVMTLAIWIRAGCFTHYYKKCLSIFMGVFFVFFALFKLMNLQAFADGFRKYDLLAARVRTYGYVYPFLELVLGFFCVAEIGLFWVHLVILILMTFSGIGVVVSLLKSDGSQANCVCMGRILNVPIGTVTLVEDFGMAAMAVVMILYELYY